MSQKIIEKRQSRAALVTEARTLLDEAETRGGMTAEEDQKYERMMTDVDKIGKEIEREERQLELDKTLEQRGGASAAAHQGGEGEKRGGGQVEMPRVATEEYRDAFRALMVNGLQGLSPEQRALVEPERRALAVGTATAGGYTVPQGFYNQIIEAQKWFGGMRQARTTVLPTATGNDIPMPTNDDTANIGALLAENAAAGAATDPTFGQKILKAWKFTSKTVLIPIELLQDSAFDLEAWISKKFGERLGRAENSFYTNGTGSNQPQGVVTGAASGKVGATGQTTSVTYDDLIDLEHSVDIAYRNSAQFMMHDLSLKALKKLKDSQARPLWLPGLALKEPDTINGYGYVINNDIPQMAANAKSMLFGDFSAYFIRDVMDVQVVRIQEKYIESGQIGFIAFSRHDGQLIDAGQGPIKYYANSAT